MNSFESLPTGRDSGFGAGGPISALAQNATTISCTTALAASEAERQRKRTQIASRKPANTIAMKSAETANNEEFCSAAQARKTGSRSFICQSFADGDEYCDTSGW